MAAIARRSHRAPVSATFTLATADDLNGTSDNTQAYDVTGADRIIVLQVNNGAAGTAGIDIIEVSHDGGTNWTAATLSLAIASDDATGTEINGVLNAAGVEPAQYAAFKLGPYQGPTAIRCSRGAAGSGTAWVTGAPSVVFFAVGGSTPTALA